AGAGRAAAGGDLPRPSDEAGAEAHARRGRVPVALWHPGALALPRRASIYARHRWGELQRGIPAGRVEQRAVRRQLELARADLDVGGLPADRVAAAVPPLLRRRLQSRVSDRLGPVFDAQPYRRRAIAAAYPDPRPRHAGAARGIRPSSRP